MQETFTKKKKMFVGNGENDRIKFRKKERWRIVTLALKDDNREHRSTYDYVSLY